MTQSSWNKKVVRIAYAAHGALGVLSGFFIGFGFVWYLKHDIFEFQTILIFALMTTLFLPGILAIVAFIFGFFNWGTAALTVLMFLFGYGLSNEILSFVFLYPVASVSLSFIWFMRQRAPK